MDTPALLSLCHDNNLDNTLKLYSPIYITKCFHEYLLVSMHSSLIQQLAAIFLLVQTDYEAEMTSTYIHKYMMITTPTCCLCSFLMDSTNALSCCISASKESLSELCSSLSNAAWLANYAHKTVCYC